MKSDNQKILKIYSIHSYPNILSLTIIWRMIQIDHNIKAPEIHKFIL